jgi:hypothetical protein
VLQYRDSVTRQYHKEIIMVVTTIRLPEPTYERLRTAAFVRRQSQSEITAAALDAYLTEEEPAREVQDR